MAVDTDSALNYRLRNASAVQSLNGARVYPLVRPEGSAGNTCIIYTLVAENDENNLAQEPMLRFNRYQVTAFATTRTAAKALADAIKSVLHPFRGTINGQYVEYIEYVSASRQEQFDSETSLYQVSRDYDIFFN